MLNPIIYKELNPVNNSTNEADYIEAKFLGFPIPLCRRLTSSADSLNTKYVRWQIFPSEYIL